MEGIERVKRDLKEVVKKLFCTSNKPSQTKIAPPIFRFSGLITADASFRTPFKEEVVTEVVSFKK
ncbi:hypothetical protein EfmAA96_01420 [Enterococcus faecium]|nr:hypothetical protein EfmAA96_01420 [Enterococcus faecium]